MKHFNITQLVTIELFPKQQDHNFKWHKEVPDSFFWKGQREGFYEFGDDEPTTEEDLIKSGYFVVDNVVYWDPFIILKFTGNVKKELKFKTLEHATLKYAALVNLHKELVGPDLLIKL